MKLIVGLGNPGPRYRGTRHNAGFLVLDELARRWDATFRRERLAEAARHRTVLLIKPTTMMNLSGRAVLAYMSRSGIRPQEVVVVHDDLHLPLGRLRFKQGGGGSGGQRGIQDIIQRIGPDFVRLKLGIGRPQPERGDVDWVLGSFREGELPIVERVVRAAADALELLLGDGLTEAMNMVNGLRLEEDGNAPAAPPG